MANEIFKELKTRIALKYNTYEYWTTGDGKDYAPLKGEVCFCAIESKDQGAQTAPTVLFKVGVDGKTKFPALKWASALAADVYDWAKVAGANVFTKDGVGNVVSGIEYDATLNDGKGGFKFTTASVATAEGLEDLQEAVAAIEKDITDNRDAWAKDDNDNTTYQFSIPTEGDDKGKLLVEKKEIGESTWTKVGAYDFVTPDELIETLEGYYTKDEVDDLIQGVEAKLPTSADYGVLSVAKGDDTITIGGTAQNPTIAVTANKFDAYGAAAEVQGNLTAYENAHASDYTNTKIDELVQGAKDYADNNDANTEYHVEYDSTNKKIKLVAGANADKMEIDATAFIKDGMIESVELVTEDDGGNKGQFLKITWNTDGDVDTDDVTYVNVTTLVDVYVGENGDYVNVTVTSDNKIKADLTDETKTKLNKVWEEVGVAAGLDAALKAELQKEIDDDIVAYNTSKNFGDIITHNVAEFATNTENGAKALAQGVKDVVDANKETWDKAGTALQASDLTAYDAGKNFGDIITHNIAEFATKAQGDKADTALQEITTTANNGLKVTNKNQIDIDTDVVFVLDCNW